jgi:hypothetical protein
MYVCMYVCMYAFSRFVLFCICRGLAMSRSPMQSVLLKYLKGFIISEVNSASEEALKQAVTNYTVITYEFMQPVHTF